MINRKKKNNNKGFTLVELLVVIAIIGILAVVAVPSLMKNIEKGKATQVMANVNAIRTETLTQYANGNTDAAVKTAVDTFINNEIKNNNKLGEQYTTVAGTGQTSGSLTLTITMTNKNEIAESIKNQLGSGASVSGSVITYVIGSK